MKSKKSSKIYPITQTTRSIFVCIPKIKIIDLIPTTNLHDSNIQNKINTQNKSYILQNKFTRKKEITVKIKNGRKIERKSKSEY